MAEPRPLTRDVLAKFLPDQESIRRFEKLFLVVSELTPAEIATLTRLVQEASIDANTAQATAQSALDQLGQIVQDAAINAGAADSKATQALDLLASIAQSLDLLAKVPVQRNDTFLVGDYIDVSPTGPSPVGKVGRLKWNDTDGTLDLGLKGGNVTLQIGQENVLIVKNDEVTALTDGEVVYVSGASGANLLVKRALADSDVTSASTIGIVTEPIGVNGQGYITTFGQVRGLNTSAFNEGDILYLSPTVAGQITNVKPTAPQHMVTVGYCTKKSAGNGEIFTKVDNGYEVDELHNVLITNPVLAGSLLIYDATVGVWKNARLTAGTNVAITNADGSITIAVTGAAPTGAAGGVLSGTYPNPGFAVDMATQIELDAHTTSVSNPHMVTKTQVGLNNVTNDAQLKQTSNLSDLTNAATARTNLGVAIGTNVQAWDADLDAIAALTGTTGLLKKTAANTWLLDTSSYEPAITTGTTAQYWRGDKSWQDFFASVRAATLTGLSTATNAVITVADTVLSALGKLQKQISDLVPSINGPAFSAYATGAQSFPAATWTKIAFNVEEFDTNNNYDSSTNYRFQPTVAGYYQITGNLFISASAASIICAIYKNGTIFKHGPQIAGNNAYGANVTALVYLNGSTDYVEVWGWNSVTQNVGTSQTYYTFFQGALVRGT